MTFLGKIRYRVGLAAGSCLDRVFAARLPARLAFRGFAHASKKDLGLLAEAIERTPTSDLEAIYERLRERVESDEHGPRYGLRIYASWHGSLERHAGGARGKKLLELGPGHTLVTGAMLVAAGAESYVGADLFPIASHDAAPYRRARAELADDRDLVRANGYYDARREMLARFDAAVRFEGDQVRFDESRLAWKHPVDAGKMPFEDGAFDVVLSNACFEHFRDAEAAARECLRVTRPGGVNLHQIDLRDHRDFSRPLEFLRFAKADWDRLFGGDGPPLAELGPARSSFQYTNRWRKGDHVRAFERAGGEVSSASVTSRTEVADALRAKLHQDFRDLPRDELEAVSVFLVVRKR